MFKKFALSIVALMFIASVVYADINKIAVIDLEKVISSSAQVQALKKEQEAKNKEFAQFVKKADADIKKQTDKAKQKALAEKYDKQIKLKRETNLANYNKKVEVVNKSINAKIEQKAKSMGYDMVLVKGLVVFGGDDITEAVVSAVK